MKTIARSRGVSKIPVREVSAQDILDAMDIRVALECKARELAIPNMIRADIAAAREIHDRDHGGDPRHRSEMNARSRAAPYAPCDNPDLLAMIADLQERLGASSRSFLSGTAGPERPRRKHALIRRGCKEGDIAGGTAPLARHIETTKKETAARLRSTALSCPATLKPAAGK